ncbi:tyrosine kinase receptor Cad96Ca-like [Asterias rubens]|uniref:tyrosine kinase receptor Cad96Ca-like n=1 Tax=Asterias rubens TaxID=7604 RepID=UPI0014558F8D|nr:tyrosine kinase receptor Cad96Ca-like [Asterias rubens]
MDDQYVITLTSTGKTFACDPEVNGCTKVTCTATNAIGTANGSQVLCPGATTTPGVAPSTTSSTTDPGRQCFCYWYIWVCIPVIVVIGGVLVVCWTWKRRRCYIRSTKRRRDKHINRDCDDGHGEMSTKPPKKRQIPLAGPSVNKNNQPDGPTNKMTKPAVYESISENKMAAGSKAPKDATYGNVGPELSFSRDLIVIENEIGRGAFGRVLLGTAQGVMGDGNRTKVAIKTLKDGADGQAKTGLLQELDLMKKVGSHPHVVNLLGYCVEKDPIYVIVEYLSKGDLKKVLIGYRSEDTGTGFSNIHGIGKSLSKTLIKFARDVASGMAFLSSQKCIHRDLAARNVLVSEDMVCKVADFGLARDVMNVRIYERESEGVLPMRWMALESLLDDVYTTESDVWSFGILLWEIVTLGARPYRLMTAKTMVAQLKEGYRMPKPGHCREELYSMMSSCWLQNPNKRPTFRSLFKQLEKSSTNEADYIKLGDLDGNIYEVTKIGDGNEKL